MTDQDLLTELQYALLEPPDNGQSWPSGVWTRDEILDNLNAGCRRVARETRAVTTYLEQFITNSSLSVSMPGDWLETAALVWRTFPANVRTPLLPMDAFEADSARPGWETTEGTPLGYVDLDTNTLELRLVPTPDVTGTLENLYVPLPATVNGNGMDMPLPDELMTAVKYDCLNVTLRGVTRLADPERAAYCAERSQISILAIQMLLQGGT